MRNFHFPGRSLVYGRRAMCATSHPSASLAAVEVLREGGNAVDAAIAAVAVLCVVEPHMTGIGGDCFCLVARPDAPVWGYNGHGRAAARATTEALLAQGIRAIGPDSIHAVTVPGAIDAWAAILAAHGRFGLDRALQPAIRYAEQGFPVAPRVAFDWGKAVARLAADPGAARHFLFAGAAPKVGDVIRFPALANTLRAIAEQGPAAFYRGPIAEDIAAAVEARGGLLRADDLAAHRGDTVDPIATNYRGLDVLEIPPSGQGITALVMLNILERFDLAALDPHGAERYHLMLEAARLAFAVRDTHVADPLDRTRRVPLPGAPTPGGDTVYLTVVDRDRTAVSLINSLYSAFGVAVATEKSGIMLQNRGACFVVDPAHPNTIAPRKRPMHTIIPGMAMRDGRCAMPFGVMGAHYQPMGHAQVVTNMIDYGMDVQAAIDCPRAFFVDEASVVENGMAAATIKGLEERGHQVALAPTPWGGGQAIAIDWDRGVLIGGSDPRKDGCAMGY